MILAGNLTPGMIIKRLAGGESDFAIAKVEMQGPFILIWPQGDLEGEPIEFRTDEKVDIHPPGMTREVVLTPADYEIVNGLIEYELTVSRDEARDCKHRDVQENLKQAEALRRIINRPGAFRLTYDQAERLEFLYIMEMDHLRDEMRAMPNGLAEYRIQRERYKAIRRLNRNLNL